jgi:hypothetical protein
MTLINNISIDSGNTYGKRRIHAELFDLGHERGVHKTRTFMKKLNIKAIRPKKRDYHPTSAFCCRPAINNFLMLGFISLLLNAAQNNFPTIFVLT